MRLGSIRPIDFKIPFKTISAARRRSPMRRRACRSAAAGLPPFPPLRFSSESLNNCVIKTNCLIPICSVSKCFNKDKPRVMDKAGRVISGVAHRVSAASFCRLPRGCSRRDPGHLPRSSGDHNKDVRPAPRCRRPLQPWLPRRRR